MFSGFHAIIYSSNAVADRAFFRDVLGFSGVDAGDGWLIFRMPPAEAALHPAEKSGQCELYFMCDNIAVAKAKLAQKGVVAEPVIDQGWGLLSHLTLPGGGRIGFYQPRHPTAIG
jgi:catechol 2,3-dioxygenase-like lactoylglutathione lyase family enzyme